jgi:hypothetical protein
MDILPDWDFMKEFISWTFQICGLGVAYNALTKWKKEALGKKKIDLAEKVLVGFQDVQSIIEVARHYQSETPLSEFEEILDGLLKDKTEDIFSGEIAYLLASHRIAKKADTLQSWYLLKNNSKVYWGEEIANLFDTLNKITTEISDSSKKLYYESKRKKTAEAPLLLEVCVSIIESETTDVTESDFDKFNQDDLCKLIRNDPDFQELNPIPSDTTLKNIVSKCMRIVEYKRIIYDSSRENDEIKIKVDQIIKKVELILKPLLKDKKIE